MEVCLIVLQKWKHLARCIALELKTGSQSFYSWILREKWSLKRFKEVGRGTFKIIQNIRILLLLHKSQNVYFFFLSKKKSSYMIFWILSPLKNFNKINFSIISFFFRDILSFTFKVNFINFLGVTFLIIAATIFIIFIFRAITKYKISLNCIFIIGRGNSFAKSKGSFTLLNSKSVFQ